MPRSASSATTGGYIDAPIGGGLRVKVTFVSCGGVSGFNVPECPTANGAVDAKGSGEFRATFEIRDGNQVLSRNSSVFEEKARAHGEVGADAKLKSIEIEHTQEVFIVASVAGYYPVVIRGGVTRKVRIQMPGGSYDPSNATVRFFGDPIEPSSGADSFARTAEAALRAYRNAEPRWSSFERKPFCADPVFSPATNTIKLKKGDNKQLSIYAKAKSDGGRATTAKWTLLNQENAEFNPGSSEGATASISYSVTGAPENGLVRVKVKLTSTAGVGEDTWIKPIEPPKGIEKISGSFDGEAKFGMPGKETIQTRTGSVTLNHLTGATPDAPAAGIYTMTDGQVVLQASGIDGSGITGCHQSGSIQGKLMGASMQVTPIGPEGKPPYEYSIVLSMPFQPLKITRSNCPESAKEFEGTTENITPLYKLSVNGQESVDGKTYFGIVSFMGLTEHWSFTGTE